MSPRANAQQNATFSRDAAGWSTRANFAVDMASNTAYGPLIGHFDFNADTSNGFDALQPSPINNAVYVNAAYLTWAGITAGSAQSFFSFTAGGDNFANFFSPDERLQRAVAARLHSLVRRRLHGDIVGRKPRARWAFRAAARG